MPDRLNEEPVVYIGMTNSELKFAGIASLGFWIPVCLIFFAIAGKAVLGIGVGAVFAFVTMWLLGKRLRVLKRGKPKGYHVMAISAWLQDRGLTSKEMIRGSEVWDIRRRRRIGKA